MNKPIIFITAAFITGIIISNLFSLHFVSAFVILAACGALYVFLRKKNDNVMFLIFAALGILLYSYQNIYFSGNNIINLTRIDEIISVKVVVSSDPEVNEERTYFYADVVSLLTKSSELTNASGKIRVTLEKNTGFTPSYGDILLIKGKLKEPLSPLNPGEFNYKKYLAYKQIHYTIYAKDTACEKTGVDVKNRFYYWSYKAKDKLLDIIYSSLPDNEARILDGLMLGNQRAISDDIYDKFKITGTVHILAVSGMNVGLIAFFVFLLLKLMRVKRKAAAAITFVLITVFAVITGAGASIVRATLMSYAVLIAVMIERDADMINSLAAAAFVILLINPSDLYDVGFQLSFLATASLIYYCEWIKKLFPKVPESISVTAASTIAAQIFLTPVMINTFHQLSLISVLTNLIIVPLSGTISVIGFAMWLFGTASQAAARIFGASIWALIKLMMLAVNLMAKVPYAAISVRTMPWLFTAVYYIFFISLPYDDVDLIYKKISAKKSLCGVLCVWAFLHVIYPSPAALYVPASRGVNAAFIQTRDNKKILMIGCDSIRSKNAVKNSVVPLLKYYGINNIDTLIAYSITEKTNIDPLFRDFRIGSVYADGVSYGNFTKADIIDGDLYFKEGSSTSIGLSSSGADISSSGRKMLFALFPPDAINTAGAVVMLCGAKTQAAAGMAAADKVVINTSNAGFFHRKNPVNGENIWDTAEKGMFYQGL